MKVTALMKRVIFNVPERMKTQKVEKIFEYQKIDHRGEKVRKQISEIEKKWCR